MPFVETPWAGSLSPRLLGTRIIEASAIGTSQRSRSFGDVAPLPGMSATGRQTPVSQDP
jgi:hypothetical protein